MHSLSRRDWLRLAALGLAGSVASRGLAQTALEPRGDRLINLGGNENPLGPSPAVLRAILEAAPHSARYPFREEERLREEIAAHEDVPLECVVLGQGCDDVLALAVHACIRPMDTVVCAEPTYFQVPDYAAKLGARIVSVPHRADSRRHDLGAMLDAVTASTALVYLCNPDNPTGTECPPVEVEAFCRAVAPRCPVIVDEVYLELAEDFAERTQVPLVREGLPLIVTRSFSKVRGLAGHRIGYALAPAPLAASLARWQRSGLNFIGVAAARAALRDVGFVDYTRIQVQRARREFEELLKELGQEFIPSQGNFVFHRTGRPLADYQTAMKQRGFYVGWPHPAPAAYPDWCRTSLGTEGEMRALAAAMRAEFGRG